MPKQTPRVGISAQDSEPQESAGQKEGSEMPKRLCPECGKVLPEGKIYCDENCLRRHFESRVRKRSESNAFWIKGEGSTNRDHNIDQIKKMIEDGLSYQDIRRKAIRFFTSRKFEEYYGIASDEIKEESERS